MIGRKERKKREVGRKEGREDKREKEKVKRGENGRKEERLRGNTLRSNSSIMFYS